MMLHCMHIPPDPRPPPTYCVDALHPCVLRTVASNTLGGIALLTPHRCPLSDSRVLERCTRPSVQRSYLASPGTTHFTSAGRSVDGAVPEPA